ncbi:Dynein-1-beta heavy chain [Diplonema papillatum]|nr:Dynein-1-beta heavy chain [Diplonema papillatum]
MKPVGIADPYNPYDLIAVPHKHTDHTNYFTMAKEGVTHVQNGDADFIPLDSWVHEHDIFHRMLKIPFFSQYRKWKTFVGWKKHVRQSRVAAYKAFLEENLFILNLDLCPQLLRVRSICQDLVNLELFAPVSETRTLDQFVDLQARNREVQARKLDGKVKETRDIIDEACKAAMTTSIPVSLTDSPEPPVAMDHTAKPSRSGRGPNSPVSSPTLNPSEPQARQQQTYIELSQKRAVCRRLTSFIRLCDYMVVDALVRLTLKSADEVKTTVLYPRPAEEGDEDIERHDSAGSIAMPGERTGGKSAHELALEAAGVSSGGKQKVMTSSGPFSGPVFIIEVVFVDDGLVIQPNLDSFVFKVESILKKFTETVVRVERFAQMEAFAQYTKHVTADHAAEADLAVGPDVNEMVAGEASYRALVQTIKSSLQAAFADVEDYALRYETFKAMYLENRLVDPHKIKEDDPPLDWFRDERQKYHTQQQDIDRLPAQKDVAIFTTKTDMLKQVLAPSPVRCLEELETLLPQIAKEKNDALFAEITQANTNLEHEPQTVEEFVDFIKFHSSVSARIDDINTEYSVIHDMYLLVMTDLEIRNPSVHEDHLRFTEGTGPAVNKLRTMVTQVEDTRDNLTKHFGDDIDGQHEKLRATVSSVSDRGKNPIIDDEDADMEEVIAYISQLAEEMERLKNREKELSAYQELIDPTRMGAGTDDEVMDVYRVVHDKLKLWTSLKDWLAKTEQWNGTVFEELNAADLETEVAKFDKTVKQVDRTLKGNPVVPKLRGLVDEFRLTLPVINCLKNPNLKEHHWTAIDDIVGRNLSQDPSYTLGILIDLKVMDLKEEIQQVSNQATQEQQLDEMLGTVQKRWQGVEFIVNPYKEQKDTYILGSVEDIITHLEDSSVVIATIASNRYCTGGLRRRVGVWEDDMKYMTETLDKWLEVQRKWMYLESIFSHKELQQQWPEDARSFQAVDKGFRDLMKRTAGNPGVKSSLTQNNYSLLPLCRKDIDALERIEKRLEEKLDQKRRLFPRFYFLSNDDLLDILAQIRHPERIAPHMLKMFDNIRKLTISESADVTHMISSEGEQVAFPKHFKARGPVEKWLGETEVSMVSALRRLAKACWEDYEVRPRMEWIFQHPAQLVLVISQIFWARDCAAAVLNGTLEQYLGRNNDLLRELAAATAQDLTFVSRSMLRTLITLEVHGRDLVEGMIRDGVDKTTAFGWTKQLRCYWENTDDSHGDIVIRQNNSYFVYGYEYLGAMGRLVITPLTDRVFMTISGALHLCLGTAPSGPAGTGKTESVKDLAKGLGRQCIVYNCSDGVTYKMMETFFSGLCQTGAWCCLDEFNRIGIEVLSVIASQLHEVREGLLKQKGDPSYKTFMFQGQPDIDLKSTFGTCITMNPGYAGRTELPDNLKALFRPISVMTPDFRMIAEVILFSEGFANATNLSLKITQLYKLSSEQLSAQHHYDFGMRALKSILVMAGDLKRSQPDVHEDLTLIIACNDSNIPKFVADDIPLFKGIMSDLFPGVEIPERNYDELLQALTRYMNAHSLEMVPTYVTKIFQFYETLIVRHGVMMVGATGGGKTAAREALADTLTDLAERKSTNSQARLVKQHVLNPKSISMAELYGSIDINTNEWQDGILPLVVKQCRQLNDAGGDGAFDHQWVVFDGPVDTLWVESMNSVLDDSKLLCLDNGVRIRLPDTIHMAFEVADLAVASPATVSRCGMVYMDFAELGWTPTVYKWLKTKMKPHIGAKTKAMLEKLFHTKLKIGLKWLFRHAKQLIVGVEQNIVQSCCDLFHALVETKGVKFPAEPASAEEEDEAVERDRKELCGVLFAFSYVWSVGGNVDDKSRLEFDTACREALEDVIAFNGPNSVFDFQVDIKTRSFTTWESSVPDFQYDASVPYFDILVPTIDTYRYSFLLKTLLQCKKPVLFSGHSGTGKSIIVQQTLRVNAEELHLVPVIIQFSAKTSAPRTQEMMESKLKAKRKNLLGGPTVDGVQKTVALFIDDLNMPALEQFGASPPVELVRQTIGNGGFYDRKYLFWKTVQDVVVLAACGPPEGGRSAVTPRVVRFFHLLQIPNLSEEAMVKIFQSILNGFFSASTFMPEVKEIVKPMVEASVDVYNTIREALRPRPAKAHYTFNLRDLSKVFQGIIQVVPRTCTSSQQAVRLWVHENSRCYYDRLVSNEDRTYFVEEVMGPTLLRKFPIAQKMNIPELFEEPVIWGDFLKPSVPVEERLYEECTDLRKLPRIFEEYLDDYNLNTQKTMNLVFFGDHCYHLSRITRIIRQPRGNALLVGVGGSGKQSLTRLAASIADYQVFQIEVNSKYSLDKFHEDLLILYQIAGIDRRPVVFLFNDSQIVDEGMVEDVNNMLNSGEVPSLFTVEERDKKINQSMEAAREAGQAATRDDIYSFFIARVRDNLHIVLGMSPVGDAFRTRCRNFPSLTNCCSVDWFDEWPTDALYQVASRQFSPDGTEFDFEVFGKELDLPSKLTNLCVTVHHSVSAMASRFYDELRRHYYITPTSYLDFISLYVILLEDKYKDVGEQLGKLKGGSEKMKETNEFIAVKKKEILEQKPLLEEATEKNTKLMSVLKVRTEKANAVRVTVSAQETEASEQQKVAAVLKADAEADLAQALPQLEAAEKSLQSLDKSSINEIKSYSNPTKAVEMTMHAVMILLEEGKYEWKRAKDLLGRSDFMRLLLEYDRDNMQKHTVAKVAKFCNDEDFTPEKIEKGGSSATKVLCIWCHAMFKYYHVNLTVEPKKQKLNKAQSDLDTTNKKLAEAQAALKTVEDELAVLQDEFSASVKEKADLEENIERSKRQLANAEVLTESLGSETERWSAQTLDLEQDMSKVPGDVFLSAASIIYFGAFTPVFRTQIVQQWMAAAKSVGVPVSDNYSLVRTLADPMQVREWQIHSLPTDNTSSENAVLCITSCESSKLARWPLMIDPQGQAAKWIRAEQAKKGLKVLKMSDPKYIQKLGQAICNGTPILIDDVAEVLDPALESVLLKQVYMIDGQPMINLGGNDHAVKYDHNFRLYLTTKMANPHYLPDVCIKVTLINFTVTMEGLEDQMLGDVVSIVKSELEEQKSKVLKSVADAKRRKKNLENQILERLESAQGNVLDEPEIIKALKQSQSNGAVLVKQLAEAEEKEKTINSERENYRSVAKRAAILYFVVAALPAIDPMYQYSLDYIKRIVRMVISSASLDDDPHKLGDNLTLLIESVTETVYRAVCRGLFNKHKTVFQVMLCTSVMRGSGLIGSGEWQFFNRPASFIDKAHAKPSVLAFLSDTQWGLIKAVSLISESLKGLIADMQAHPKGWHEWIVQDEPQDLPLPKGSVDWNEVCSPFQRCLIIRCFREEKMFLQLIQFVDKQMGPKYVEAPAFDLKVAFEDSGVERPIMFILSQGSDPTEGFLKWANEVGRKVRYVALGQGQEGPARRLVESGKKAGDWILLQNCHLGKSFMGELQEMVAALDPSDKALKPDFRMWLTSMPAAYFPIPILQNSIKITNEAPSGLKANMNRCFADIPSAELSFFDDTGKWTDLTSGIGRSHAYKKLLYGLCFFHSIILERRKFGSLGWNVTYEWNDTDLVVSRQWLQLFLEQEDVPWDSMLYIIGEINYGGRVTDPLDRLCLASVLKTYFNTDILDDAYVFSKSGVYKAPPEADLPRYRAEIHQMPRQDAPEVFGLHQNASLRYQLQVSSELLGTLLMIQPRESSKGSGVSPEELVKKKAKEIIEMLPEPMLLEEEAGPTSLTTMPNGVPNSLSTVLRHEVEKYNRLLTHQRKTLTELEKAIAGLTVLSEALDKMYLDFLNDTVPALWSQVSYLSLKPLGAWMADLVRRVDHCRKWLKKGEPSSFWLPGLFAPHGFMTGILQGHARQHVISVDVLAFSFVILPEGEPEEKPESGVYIHGMFSDSFRWDHTDATMVDSLPGESYANLPNIHLLPRERHVCPPEAYPCPAYITTSRKGVLSSLGASTNFIMCVDVPTDLGRDFWIRKGAAMLCQLNN